MKIQPAPFNSHPVPWLLPALFVAELSGLASVLLAYRFEGKAGFADFMRSRPGVLCLVSTLLMVLALAVVAWQCWIGIRSGSKNWLLTVIMNGAMVVGLISVGELVLRLGAVRSTVGLHVAGHMLYPNRWDETAENFKAILKHAETVQPFWVADEDFGWNVGSNRRSADGLYLSTVQGIRAPEIGREIPHPPEGCRIAFVGDSFTFGEEVDYHHAWVSLLERKFHERCQVLNFAVGGYGIDQMYLRYMRDVRPWRPTAVVLAFVNHDVVRTLAVYSFLMFPGGETPFAKPRFILRDGELAQINRPLVPLQEIFKRQFIQDLPFIEYDINYHASEWDRPGWRWLSTSYFMRLLLAFYPLHEPDRVEIADERIGAINAALFQRFRSAVIEDGAVPLIVYLPSVEEVPEIPAWTPVGTRVLAEGDVPHVNIRDCMARGYTNEMFMPVGHGQHYAAEGNRIAAGCLQDSVGALIGASQPSPRVSK